MQNRSRRQADQFEANAEAGLDAFGGAISCSAPTRVQLAGAAFKPFFRARHVHINPPTKLSERDAVRLVAIAANGPLAKAVLLGKFRLGHVFVENAAAV